MKKCAVLLLLVFATTSWGFGFNHVWTIDLDHDWGGTWDCDWDHDFEWDQCDFSFQYPIRQDCDWSDWRDDYCPPDDDGYPDTCNTIPAPGALVLSGLGAGLVGMLRRRRAL